MKTTLKQLRDADACTERYVFLRKALGPNYGDSTPITMQQILDSNGLDDCLWAVFNTQHGAGDKLLRLFACDCAEHVLPIFEKKCPDDMRPRNAIVVARRFANGEASDTERAAARDAAWAAAWAAARDVEQQWQTAHFREMFIAAEDLAVTP